MTANAAAEQLSEVLRLCTLLADRVLDAEIMGRPVPAEQAIALAKAARLLQDHGVEWPPLVRQALHELAGKAEKLEPQPEPLEDIDQQGLTRFLAQLWKEKGQS